jgi:hypothetical protein
MDRNYVADRHVVARFLSDQLSEEELQAFEEYMLAHPEVVHELESTARLKVGLHKLNETGELTRLLKPKAFFGDTPYTALAASVAILALGSFFIFRNVSHEPPTLAASVGVFVDRPEARLPIGHAYAILRTRGNSYDAEIELPAHSQAIELRVLPEVAAHPARYRATLARIADDDSLREMGTVGGLIPGQDGFVSLYVDSSKLMRGRYRLSLSGDAASDAVDAVSTFKLKFNQPVGR